MSQNINKKIQEVLGEIRPSLQADGGDIEFVKFENGILTLKIKGACLGCPMAKMTFDQGISQVLKEKIPEIKEIRWS